ncbi:hypothetical protein Acsp06_38710 [Actinomycetospora sp. NBRC 106375]|uniref:hypothetical protein n=1 Tax=Actinomycetospora sp. NBRC 106375 TaxID=3032207 RepID=UPI0024A0CA7C|nr:hypothetical protein [Actinomycetospora sp. NBRC 106375]GLZ47686.1 hypothetical protein Acsp06_38710 [Actinomycetospora sp. NBRC 106375]
MSTHLTPASPVHLAPSYATPAWLMRGLTNEPGVLSLYAGRLRLVTGAGVVFDAPLSAVERLAFPWYQGAAGLRVTISGHRYRIALGRPHGAGLPPARLLDASGPDRAGAENPGAVTVHSVLEGRRAGRVWRTLLGA